MTNVQRRCLAAALMAGMMFLASIYALLGVLLTSMIEYFGLTDSAQGLASSAASAGGVIALVSSFLLIGRLPKTMLLRIALGICAVFIALLKIAPAFGVFVALWLVIGVGMGYIDMLLSSCMADLYHGRTATRMMCTLHMLYGVSSMLCPVIFNRLMAGGMVWNSVYLCVAAAGALLLFYTIFAVRFARMTGHGSEQRMSFKTMGGMLAKGMMPGLIAAMFCHGMFLGGLNTWLTRFVSVTLDSPMGAMALSFMFLGVMASRLIVPSLPITPMQYVRVGGLLGGAVLLIALPFGNSLVMCIAAVIAGLFFGGLIPCILDIGCVETPQSSMLATTVLMLSLYIGQVIVSPVIGALEASVGLQWGIALCGAFTILCSVCCIWAGMGKK